MSMYAEYIRDNMEIDLLKENNPLDADIYEQIYYTGLWNLYWLVRGY